MADHYTYVHPSGQRDISASPAALLQLKIPYGFEQYPMMTQFGMNGDHRNADSAQTSYDLSPYQDTSTTPSPPGLITSTDGPEVATWSSSLLPDSPHLALSSSNSTSSQAQSRKSRKEKLRIELAPNQPPTTQGRPRARVFVACLQCRGRKIRCDGAKPVCFHCSQRDGDEQCTYDSLPKRRGPDRVQGARTRGTKAQEEGEPRRRRRRSTAAVEQAAAGGSRSVRRPSIAAEPSAIDTLGDTAVSVHPQQSGVRPNTQEPNSFEALENSVQFSSTASSGQMLALATTSSGHSPPVARLVEHDNTIETTFHSQDGASYSEAIPPANAALVENRLEWELRGISPDPSVQFSRKIWWDHLLDLYAVSVRVSYGSPPLELAPRDGSVSQIINDVRFMFRSSNYTFSFFNVPRFFNNFADPVRRSRMQPSLLLSLLAVSTFLQSPGRAYPEESRRMAVLLRDEAQGYLEASLQARAIDEELAQAAWILSFFEVCAHPRHQMTRIHASLNILDSIIRSLAMSYLDANNPSASTFTRNAVPVVEVSAEQYFPPNQPYITSMSMPSPIQQYAQPQQIGVDPTVRPASCRCDSLSLGFQWPESHTQVPGWIATAMWNPEWTEGEIRKEECRRLCWSTLMLISGHTSFSAAVNWRSLDLFIGEPSNYSLLFPGESLFSSHAHGYFDTVGGKGTVWALYLRAMLLWNACVRMRHDASFSDLDRRDFAMRAWLETEAIEKALQWHTCGIERAFMYNGREFLFNTRMCISYEFQRYIPHVLIGTNRQKSEEWLRAQGKRAKMVIFAMHAITGNHKDSILQRPWYMWWFMGQIFRALTLWQHDNSLTIALDVCKAFLEPIEYLAKFYPGPVQNIRLDDLRERLRLALLTAEGSGEYVPTPIYML